MSKPKGSRTQYISAGVHGNVSKSTLSGMRKLRYGGDKLLAKFDAYLKGKNPWITIPNPDKTKTNKRFIKVRANDHYGDHKAYLRGKV